ncbi:7022_t:CDS:2 [Racocetra fulgida]|uniref:7022_t:CDS:1 n=1 Tax=Racocetra fulgida TaxID=60492 RepID=A0A9N9FI99_9GLOM|nr:7022_t:CDS:2 [Racocetra fulgida]
MRPFHIQLLSNVMLITLVLNLFITLATAFAPTSRYFQSSVVIGDKIYFLGGIGVSGRGSNEIFYLDVSSPFNIANLKWTDLTIIAPIPVASAFSPSCSGGNKNSTIFLFEHRSTNTVNSTSLVTFTFDTTTQKWSNAITTGTAPPTRQEMKAVVDKNGRIYISGGFDPYTTLRSSNNTYVLDSLSLSWLSSYPSAPIIRSDYAAILLPSGLIVYIGGTNDDTTATEIDMTKYRKYRPDDDPYIATPGTGNREYREHATSGTNIHESRYGASTPSTITNQYVAPSFVSNMSSTQYPDAPNFTYQSGAPDAAFIHPGTPTPGSMHNQNVFAQGPQGSSIHVVYTHGHVAQNVTDGIPTPGTRSIYSNFTNNS